MKSNKVFKLLLIEIMVEIYPKKSEDHSQYKDETEIIFYIIMRVVVMRVGCVSGYGGCCCPRNRNSENARREASA